MPTLLVILNDIMAYLSGFFFGRTPLTSLSPKKTWEGFAGGLVFTVVGSFFLGHALAQWKWMTCPRTDFARTWLVRAVLCCAAPPPSPCAFVRT